MKGILKDKTHKTHRVRMEGTTQSHSISAVRWSVPQEKLQAHSSAPISLVKSSTCMQHNSRHQGLRNLRSLQECVKFINEWKERVVQICKEPDGEEASCSKWQQRSLEERSLEERSLEESRKLILQWAEELKSVDTLFEQAQTQGNDSVESTEDDKNTDDQDLVEQRIMEWARELQTVSENCGVPGDELPQTLRHMGLRKKRLMHLLPLLEFITWSLLKEDSKGLVPQLWLSAKQHTWKAGTPRYIPNSVWDWICSAEDDVTLDPMSSHPWLLLSDDRKRVQEALSEAMLPPSRQRFDGWPCVLGWEGFSSGRHYWEVDLANDGYWRLGLTTASARRQGRFPMTPAAGYWALWRSTHHFYACTKPETPLPMELVPRRVGVYLDYEDGQISFFDAKNKSHIYTFTGTFREKLYPLFAPLDGRTLITISSPKSAAVP
uniref:E3 ubiquitin-protein ligase TRIM39-like n=1 Tax=Paramormyrops kingsleyae TaxID=1676925 RepID=A0A3B3RRF4_9TELE|nr:E3 ubiquitin-protein ligase TRIM39-like [Paramormyrops kingsleyae]